MVIYDLISSTGEYIHTNLESFKVAKQWKKKYVGSKIVRSEYQLISKRNM